MSQALIIGFGLSGRSATSLLLNLGWKVIATDRNAATLKSDPSAASLIQKGCVLIEEAALDPLLESLSGIDLAILSPGVSPTNPLVQRILAAGIEVIGEVELAFRHLLNPTIGVTGTNGKTTVTLLVTHVLQCAGKRARALGNVGVPLAMEMGTLLPGEVVVLELSSYQLETLRLKKLDAAVILNITPDHLDRYGSLEKYAKAKISIADCLKDPAAFYVEESVYKAFPDLCHGLSSGISIQGYGYDKALSYSTDLFAVFKNGKKIFELPDSLARCKSHELENFIAAFALLEKWEISPEIFIAAFNTFKKPAHRIEFVKSWRNVHFYDDSKGTNIDAVIRAIERMPGPTLLIAGGVDKGAPYTPWIGAFGDKVKKIFAIGQAAAKIEADLSKAIPVEICEDMDGAVQKAFASASSGDNILLSPGCSSLDMFKDYADRGREFQRCVNLLLRSR